MGRYTLSVKGETALETVLRGIYAFRILDREPNTMIISEPVACVFIHELRLKNARGEEAQVKDVIGATLYGLKILIEKDSTDGKIQILEVL